jgi:fibronectin type 3 domain-containing protein
VVGYNVYRGTMAGGPYTKVGSLVAGTTFLDSNVVAGATYYYCVTAVGATGQESVYSAVAAATIPTP